MHLCILLGYALELQVLRVFNALDMLGGHGGQSHPLKSSLSYPPVHKIKYVHIVGVDPKGDKSIR